MPAITNQECWDMLEEKLLQIAELKNGNNGWDTRVAVALLVSAGRDRDFRFIDSDAFRCTCKVAGLQFKPTYQLIVRTLDSLKKGLHIDLKRSLMEN